MANVYLIRQDTSHLYGAYMVSAVVIAESMKQARKLAHNAALAHKTSDGSEIGFYNDLIVIHKIGNNGRYGQRQQPVVCCLQIGERSELPTGNYTPFERGSKPRWQLQR